MEVIGGIASTIQLVETGLKLFRTLDQFACSYKGVAAELQMIAHHTKSLSQSVQEAEAEVRWGRHQGIYLPDVAQNFNDLCGHVHTCFGKIAKLITRMDAGKGVLNKLEYALRKRDVMEELRKDLETWKSSLQIMLQVLQLNASRKAATTDKATVREQRLHIIQLMSENAEATRRYQQLVATQPTFDTSGDRGSPAPNRNLPKRLLDCAAAVARLQESIEAAISKWDDDRDRCLDEIWYDSEDVSKQVGRLMRRPWNTPSSKGGRAFETAEPINWTSQSPGLPSSRGSGSIRPDATPVLSIGTSAATLPATNYSTYEHSRMAPTDPKSRQDSCHAITFASTERLYRDEHRQCDSRPPKSIDLDEHEAHADARTADAVARRNLAEKQAQRTVTELGPAKILQAASISESSSTSSSMSLSVDFGESLDLVAEKPSRRSRQTASAERIETIQGSWKEPEEARIRNSSKEYELAMRSVSQMAKMEATTEHYAGRPSFRRYSEDNGTVADDWEQNSLLLDRLLQKWTIAGRLQ